MTAQKATWDEQGATPAPSGSVDPSHAHGSTPQPTPDHPTAAGVVSGSRKPGRGLSFPALLRQAMNRRKASRADIYGVTGSCSTSVKHWLDGTSYPDHGTVIVVAELLHWPSLVERSLADRSGTCEGCGNPTQATRGRHGPRYCGAVCLKRTRDRVANERRRTQKAGLWKRRAERAEEAVAAFCRDCTVGEGICRDDGCHLRGASPLPFIPLSKVSRRAA